MLTTTRKLTRATRARKAEKNAHWMCTSSYYEAGQVFAVSQWAFLAHFLLLLQTRMELMGVRLQFEFCPGRSRQVRLRSPTSLAYLNKLRQSAASLRPENELVKPAPGERPSTSLFRRLHDVGNPTPDQSR